MQDNLDAREAKYLRSVLGLMTESEELEYMQELIAKYPDRTKLTLMDMDASGESWQ